MPLVTLFLVGAKGTEIKIMGKKRQFARGDGNMWRGGVSGVLSSVSLFFYLQRLTTLLCVWSIIPRVLVFLHFAFPGLTCCLILCLGKCCLVSALLSSLRPWADPSPLFLSQPHLPSLLSVIRDTSTQGHSLFIPCETAISFELERLSLLLVRFFFLSLPHFLYLFQCLSLCPSSLFCSASCMLALVECLASAAAMDFFSRLVLA